MFAIVSLKKSQNNNFLNSLINYFKKPRYYIKSEKVNNGIVVILEVFKPNKINWNNINKTLKKFDGKILVENQLNTPQNINLNYNMEFSIKNMLYIAKNIIARLDIVMKNKNIIFYDINGIYSYFLKEIIQNVNIILVITARIDYYTELSKQYFQDYGVIIKVSQYFPNLSDYSIMVLTENIKTNITYNGLIISNNYDKPSCVCINNFNYHIPTKYSIFDSFNIDKIALLNCLYSYCKCDELEKIKPISCRFNNTDISFNQIYKKLNSIYNKN